MSAAKDKSGDVGEACVLVTGGTGFLGTAILHELAGQGAKLAVMARASSDRSLLAGLDVEWFEGDLVDPASVVRAVEAFGAFARERDLRPLVVHSGAVISYRSRDRELQQRVNVEGTRAVLDGCEAGGIERLAHVSSVVAVAYAKSHDAVITEDTPFNGAELGVDYVDTKRAAEELALERAASGCCEVVVVNPGAIFGPARSGSNTKRFLTKMRDGKMGPLTPPGGLGVVGVEDTAQGVRLALERGANGRRFLLIESYLPALELFRTAARTLGVREPRGAVPRGLWSAARLGVKGFDRLFPTSLLTPQSMTMLAACFPCDASRAREELGWNPGPFVPVLEATVASL